MYSFVSQRKPPPQQQNPKGNSGFYCFSSRHLPFLLPASKDGTQSIGAPASVSTFRKPPETSMTSRFKGFKFGDVGAMAMSSVPSAAATSVSGRNNTSTTLDPSKGDLGIGVTPRGRSLLSVWDDVVSFPAPGENDAVACGCPRCTSLAAKKKEEKRRAMIAHDEWNRLEAAEFCELRIMATN